MSDFIEEIRCALAMREAGYAALLGHEATAEMLRRHDALVKALEGIAEFCSSDANTLGAVERLAHIRNTAVNVLAHVGSPTPVDK